MNLALPDKVIRRLSKKAAILVVVHAALFVFSFFLAFFTRNDFSFSGGWLPVFAATVGSVVALKVVVFYMLGLCHVSWRRVSFGDLTALLWAATLTMLILATIDSLFLSTGRLPSVKRVPRSVILLDWASTILLVGGMRTLWRSFYEELRPLFSKTPTKSALIIGASQAGELLARNLKALPTAPTTSSASSTTTRRSMATASPASRFSEASIGQAWRWPAAGSTRCSCSRARSPANGFADCSTNAPMPAPK